MSDHIPIYSLGDFCAWGRKIEKKQKKERKGKRRNNEKKGTQKSQYKK